MPEHSRRPRVLVATALGIEARAVRGALAAARDPGPAVAVHRTGMGPDRARRAAAAWRADPVACAADGLAVTGFCAGIAPGLRPGDVVVATEVRGPGGTVTELPGHAELLTALQDCVPELTVRHGPLVTVDRVVRGAERDALRAAGAVAADMESAHLVAAAAGRPAVVMRVVSDTAEHELMRAGMLVQGLRAYRALRRAAPALGLWATLLGPADTSVDVRDGGLL